MIDTDKKFCSILLDILSAKGLNQIVCSPGSRNAPLLIAAAARPQLKKHFVVDERSASFMALGISLVSKNPVALVCTSGTALLNYAPGVAEAYYQGIPIIVISADRPPQWIDQDDSQTIHQENVLSNFVKKSFNFPSDKYTDKELIWYVNRMVNEAYICAISGKPGPVHINIPLSEPLNGKLERQEFSQRIIDLLTPDAFNNKEIIKKLAEKAAESKILLTAGFMQPDANLQKVVSRFCKFKNVAVMAETISNLHLKEEDYKIDSVLTSFTSEILDNLKPDIVITIGGSLISRKLKEYLRRNSKSIEHWSIGTSNIVSDPFMSLTFKIEIEPRSFFRNLNSELRKKSKKFNIEVSDYSTKWSGLRKISSSLKDTYIDLCKWSELKAFEIILKNLPSDYNLFLSNGTAIRYAQIINYRLPHASYCNRGVSGIDGSVSTAIGGAMEYKGKTLLITGDLSMAYDITSLSLKEVPDRFKIIVIDNQGGGIFRFIPSTSILEEREEYFCQSPLLPLKHLAEGYGWNYFEANNEGALKDTLEEFLSHPRKAIFKISCDGIKSAEILSDYMKCKAKI